MSVQCLKDLLGELASLVRQSDQAPWADRFDALSAALDERPLEAAREVLALFEGEARLDGLVLTQGGVAYKPPGPLRELAFTWARAQNQVYEAALAVWHAHKPRAPAQAGAPDRPRMLLDYGGGSQVWAVRDGFVVRYDCGSHVSRFRDDAITLEETEQAMLGPPHFSHMLIALQMRLQAAGIDPCTGSVTPLPDPS